MKMFVKISFKKKTLIDVMNKAMKKKAKIF